MSTTTDNDIKNDIELKANQPKLEYQPPLTDEEAKIISELNNTQKWIGKHEGKYKRQIKQVLTTSYDHTRRKWAIKKTHDFVGIIPLKTRTIRIVPRGHPDTRMNYQLMYAYNCNIDPNTLDKVQIGGKQINPFSPIFHAENLYELISQIERHGLLSNYKNEIEESQFLKGKILWEKNFSKGYFPTEKQFLQTSYLTRDILENRILKEALRITNESLSIHRNDEDESSIKKKISILYNKFYGINKLEDNPPKVVYHSLNQKYQKAIPFCLTIIKRKWQILDKDLKPIHAKGHLVDINITFQDFLIQFLDEHKIKNLQTHYYFLGEHKNTKKTWKYRQRLDMLIKTTDNKHIIIDAKNKPGLSKGDILDVKDIRQMLVYSKFMKDIKTKLYLDSNKVIIVYPEASKKPTHHKGDEHTFTPIDGDPVHIYTKPINMIAPNLLKSMHDFLIYLGNFNVGSDLPTNPLECNCRLAKHQKKT